MRWVGFISISVGYKSRTAGRAIDWRMFSRGLAAELDVEAI
jgi:hypothetical protein